MFRNTPVSGKGESARSICRFGIDARIRPLFEEAVVRDNFRTHSIVWRPLLSNASIVSTFNIEFLPDIDGVISATPFSSSFYGPQEWHYVQLSTIQQLRVINIHHRYNIYVKSINKIDTIVFLPFKLPEHFRLHIDHYNTERSSFFQTDHLSFGLIQTGLW